MKSHPVSTFVACLVVAPALFPASAGAVSDDATLNQLVQSGRNRQSGTWVNALLPEATGESVASAGGPSADAQFMRSIAYYTRDMLDRAGWVNPYAGDGGYAAGNYLVNVGIGAGVTIGGVA